MAKRKPLTEKQRVTRKAYTKELNRLKRFIKRAEERGYRFTEKTKSDILTAPSRITTTSVKKLQKITPSDLYKKATAISQEGKVISGTEKRQEERTLRARKSAETRRQRKEREKLPDSSHSWEDERREKDKEQKDQREAEGYSSDFYLGIHIYEQVLDLISNIDINFQESATHLREVLDNEIKTYGLEKVMESIAQAPTEVIEKCQQALNYKSSDSRHKQAISELLNIIRGTIPTSQDMRDIEDWAEADDWVDSLF